VSAAGVILHLPAGWHAFGIGHGVPVFLLETDVQNAFEK